PVVPLCLQIVEIDAPALMRDRGNGDNARTLYTIEQRQQQTSQCEVPKYVGAELKFKTVDSFQAARRRHHPRIVNKHMERLLSRKLARGKLADRSQRRQ